MLSRDLDPVLGHARVLGEGLDDERRRVVAYEGDAVVGVGVFERLFGPHAEGVLAIRRGDSAALVPYLFDELIERIQASGLVAVRFVFERPEQHDFARRLSAVHSHCSLRRDWLDVRLEPSSAIAASEVAA